MSPAVGDAEEAAVELDSDYARHMAAGDDGDSAPEAGGATDDKHVVTSRAGQSPTSDDSDADSGDADLEYAHDSDEDAKPEADPAVLAAAMEDTARMHREFKRQERERQAAKREATDGCGDGRLRRRR
jgi:hypothetical protein